MHVLLMGSGGREHALAWMIDKSPLLSRLSVVGVNPGFPPNVTQVTGDPVAFAVHEAVDLVVVGPEAPLAEGIADRMGEQGISVFGPTQRAAQLESSKAFAKSFMERHDIPTARWSVHDSEASALQAIVGPCVVKADGLAAGKGVLIAQDAAKARDAVKEVFSGKFGEAASQVVIEELLVGPEVSVLALCDGHRAVGLMPCRDHKRRFDADAGPNTGGMGAICPAPGVTQADLQMVLDRVLQPTVDGMRQEGMPFRGVLYAGIMWTQDGPKVLEFNVRFGDPECQPLMMMMGEDLLPWLDGAARGQLPGDQMRWHQGSACCVVMVSGGYPGTIETGSPITGVPDPAENEMVFFAGARRDGIEVVNSGGRVLGVTARGSDLEEARVRAYGLVSRIDFVTADWRKDIGISR